ncbi:hypothetical protein D1007_01477 [Hordeum vulgare]|nr:hypothetical protein D1007_01477 [Hordeum vulgare]
MCSKMFQGIELQARCALGSIWREDVSSPLMLDDADYLDFFTKVVEWLGAGAKNVGLIVAEECRNLLAHAILHVFNHLLRIDPCFDFEAMIAPFLRSSVVPWRKK